MSARRAISEIARDYAKWYAAGGGSDATTHHRMVYRAMPEIRKHRVKTFLDVGCGRGRVLRELTVVHGLEGAGTEIVPDLLRRDLKKLAVYPYFIGDLGKLDDSDFDLVLLVELLDHLRDEDELDECLVHVKRLSRLGVMATVGGPSDRRTVDEDPDWWLWYLGAAMDRDPQINEDRDGTRLYTFWWEVPG